MFNGVEAASDDAACDGACLAATAGRLRQVRAAHVRFLALWAVDHLMGDAAANVRFAADVDDDPSDGDRPSDNRAATHVENRPLFRHRRLDD